MSRILIIDDDEMVLQLMQRLLIEHGFEVLATADGPHGIELYKGHAPELVLLDIALPGMNGLDVLKRIRELDQDAKVIMITGYGSEETFQHALRDGAYDFLRKPVRANALLEKIHTALGS
jgi:DNA-binding NtrC family response regulator